MPNPRSLILTTLALLLSACAAPWDHPEEPPKLTDIAAPEPFVDQRPDPDPSSRGIEMKLLTVDDSGARVARSLAPYAEQTTIAHDDLQRWRSWGIRWVQIPIEDLDPLLQSQKSVGVIENRWLGEFPRWRALIRAGELSNQTVRVQGSRDRAITGRPRLLARAWTTPRIDDEGRPTSRIAIDLALQLIDPNNRPALGQLAPTQPIDQGSFLGPRPLHLELDDSHALLLVADDPDNTWDTADNPTNTNEQTPGPNAPNLRTLGERMLSTRGSGTVAPGDRYIPPRKVLIILVPNTDPGYTLLPKARAQETTP